MFLITIPSQTMTRFLFLIAAAMVIVSASGCVQQELAPELKYSPDEAKLIKEKIETFDW